MALRKIKRTMKKILFYDVAAESLGAKTVLEDYIRKYREKKDIYSYFVVSVLSYPDSENVKIIRLPWCKKSWFHRLYCDYIYMPKLLKKLNVDEVFSLQNISLPVSTFKQTVLVHNAIPFTEYSFSLFKDPFLFVYQKIIGYLIKRGCKRANKVIVQSNWMRNRVIKICGISSNIIEVEKVNQEFKSNYNKNCILNSDFFYPSSAFSYKNHGIILEACKILKKEGINNYSVVFTLNGNENKLSRKLKKEAEKEELPIKFCGRIDKTLMSYYYKNYTLIFPSFLETLGIPLFEAGIFGTRIIAADCEYARETLGNIKAEYFDYTSGKELACIMRKVIDEVNSK